MIQIKKSTRQKLNFAAVFCNDYCKFSQQYSDYNTCTQFFFSYKRTNACKCFDQRSHIGIQLVAWLIINRSVQRMAHMQNVRIHPFIMRPAVVNRRRVGTTNKCGWDRTASFRTEVADIFFHASRSWRFYARVLVSIICERACPNNKGSYKSAIQQSACVIYLNRV